MILNVVLYLGYTLGSVAGLLMLKTHLPIAKQALNGNIVWRPLAYVGAGTLLYIAGFALWLGILSRNELSIAYPTAIGLTLVISTLASWLILGEAVSAVRMGGMLLIFGGIILIARS
jgi:multidrug transporter EmrE-like cation transporter